MASIKSFQIFGLCITGIILCLVPHFMIDSSSKLTYDVNQSQIYSSTNSDSYFHVSMITMGCCIPMLIEYIMDVLFFSFRTDKKLRHFTLTRGIFIFILFVPELIILYYVVPNSYEEFLGSIFAIRTMVCVCLAFSEIESYRGNVISSKNCFITMILMILVLIIRSFNSIMSFPIADIIQMIISILLILALCTLIIIWFRKLVTKKLDEWDTSQLISHSRIIRSEIIQTQ
eukprot:gene3820-7609_t